MYYSITTNIKSNPTTAINMRNLNIQMEKVFVGFG